MIFNLQLPYLDVVNLSKNVVENYMKWLLDLFAVGSILSGILVITSSNPVISILFLVITFALSACYLLIIGVSFVGLTYLIVYIGAIAVLFLFVVIILNVRVSEIIAVGTEHTKNLPLGFFVGIFFTFEFLSILPAFSFNSAKFFFTQMNAIYLNLNLPVNFDSIHQSSQKFIWDTEFINFSQIQSLGQGLYTYGSLGLFLASFVLLLGILGPILTCRQ